MQETAVIRAQGFCACVVVSAVASYERQAHGVLCRAESRTFLQGSGIDAMGITSVLGCLVLDSPAPKALFQRGSTVLYACFDVPDLLVYHRNMCVLRSPRGVFLSLFFSNGERCLVRVAGGVFLTGIVCLFRATSGVVFLCDGGLVAWFGTNGGVLFRTDGLCFIIKLRARVSLIRQTCYRLSYYCKYIESTPIPRN